jgi:NAD(P)-dependent dehydrogenase (short-subunit alcohol dehydrogenase family)
MQEDHPFSLHGKTIVVTGASSGIGRQCAIACSRMGAKVILIGRNSARLAGTNELLVAGAGHLVLSVDLNQFAIVAEKIDSEKKNIGTIAGVVHCAGISTTLPVRMINENHLHDFFQTNVNGAINLTQLLVKPGFMPDGGSVVFMTSVMGLVGEAGKTLYSLTKGALLAGSKSMAIELAPKKIRVNCISPGVVITPMSGSAVYSQDEASLERIKSYHPLGLGDVVDVANACVFLLSDASRWITGSNLIVDGGYTAR